MRSRHDSRESPVGRILSRMRPRRSFALALLVLSACTTSRTLPLAQLDGTTRIEVRSRYDSSASHVIVARDEIERAVAAMRSFESGWREEMATLPAGSVVAVYYRDTTTVGVF